MELSQKTRRYGIICSVLVIFILVIGYTCQGKEPKADDYTSRRKRMVEKQIAARGISDQRVLSAMARVERHRFVPADIRELAYKDRPLPIGEGQTISQPYIVALMTELLDLKKSDKVLEVGTGSGYQAAVLAELGAKVYSIEIIPSLGQRAAKLLEGMGYRSVQVKIGDGYQGWPDHAPFQKMIITAAAPYLPAPLIEQLADGGRLVVPLGVEDEVQYLEVVDKVKGKLHRRVVTAVRFVPMTGEIREKGAE